MAGRSEGGSWEELGLLCGRKPRRGGGGGHGICCGRGDPELDEEQNASDKPQQPWHTAPPPVPAAQNEKPPESNRSSGSGCKVCLAVLCGSLILGLLVFVIFSLSSRNNHGGSNGGSNAEVFTNSSGTPLSSSSSSADGPQQPARPPTLEFYVYRAQIDNTFPPENINVADLAGVLQYVHEHVVIQAPRLDRIDRIQRWKVTLQTTQEYWNVHHRHFGHYIDFGDGGRCIENCGAPSGLDPEATFRQYGFLVGCQADESGHSGYKATVQTRSCDQDDSDACQTHAPILYSLPGECPTRAVEEATEEHIVDDSVQTKDDACRQSMPGGRCSAATGAPDCTFQTEDAGYISISELAGFRDDAHYDAWWRNSTGHDEEMENNVEYRQYDENHDLYDRGVNWNWWNNKFDEDACAHRMAEAERLFAEKYPDSGALEEPLCDFIAWNQEEFAQPIDHTNGVSPTRGFEWQE